MLVLLPQWPTFAPVGWGCRAGPPLTACLLQLTASCRPVLPAQLGIKVAPTFLLYKRGEQVAMMTGAKAEQLRELIDKHM